jgi:hypothetical protein
VNRPWIWNLVLLIALAVVIARFPSSLSAPPVTLPAVAPPPTREPFALPPALPPPTEEALREIANRSLFSPSRGKVALATATEPPAPPPVPAAPLKVTLFGVVIEEEGGKYAYLQDSSGGGSSRPKKYREGDSFAGAKVKSIRPDRVILETGSLEQIVNLRSPKEGIPNLARKSLPVNRAAPKLSPAPRPAPRPARRLQRPNTVTRSRRPTRVPTRPRPRPALRDAYSDEIPGEEWPGQFDGGEDYYQDEYPGHGGDPDYYYEDEEYRGEGNEASW